MDDALIAYLAGVIDSDGCITLVAIRTPTGTTYQVRLSINQTAPEAIELLAATFGGPRWMVTDPRHLSANGKPKHGWQLASHKAVAAIRALLPHLRIRRRQAEIALAFQEWLHEPGHYYTQPRVVTYTRTDGQTVNYTRQQRVLGEPARLKMLEYARAIRSLNDSRAPAI